MIKNGNNMRKIIRNAIQCKKCGDIIESHYRHDYVQCKCGSCAVDGGCDYLRRTAANNYSYKELSEFIEISEMNTIINNEDKKAAE